MPSIQEAVATLKTELHKDGVESHIQNTFDNVACYLILLNSSCPSVQVVQKLCAVLRQPLLPLYNACLQSALQLSCSLLSAILGRVCDAHDSKDEDLRAAWDTAAKIILSGILDFLDQKDGSNIGPDVTAWETLYRIICEFFFPGSGRGLSAFSIPLCLSAYSTLTEIATRQISIQNALRQRAVLGGERLGAAISETRDYLLLEALLLLFARLLPPTHNTSQGKLRRFKFVKEVLGSPKLFKCSAELLDVVHNISDTLWDDIAARIIDVLARADVTYPQPFSVDEIDVCGRIFPQPLATDRLIMDKTAFLANVVEDEEACESLQVSYSQIRTITLDNSEKNVARGKVLIMVYLTSPPLIGNVEMQHPGEGHLHAKFLLQNDTLGRFMEGLRRRGVGKLNFLNPLTRAEKKRKSISIGSEFKFIDSSPIPPTASFEGKVQHVNEVYKTDIEGPTASHTASLSCVADEDCLCTPDPMLPIKDENGITSVLESPGIEAPVIIKGTRLVTPVKAPESVQDSATTRISLSSDSDKLSDISEFEPDYTMGTEPTVAGVSTYHNNGSKSLPHKIDCTPVTSVVSKGNKKLSDTAPKAAGRTGGKAQKSLEGEKLRSTSVSPIFGSSSSTQIDLSPKPLSEADTLLTMIDTGVPKDLSVTSRDVVDASMVKKTGVSERGPSDTEPTVSSRRLQIASGSIADGIEPHAWCLTPSNQKVHSRIETARDKGVPPKVAGSRRKREPTKLQSRRAAEVDDEPAPPRKKNREDKNGTEEVKLDETLPDVNLISRVKRPQLNTAKRSPHHVDPMVKVDHEGLKPVGQGTRRSSRIRKRQMPTTSRTRPNAMRGKPQKGKDADGQSSWSVERKKLGAVTLRDPGVEIGQDTKSTFGLHVVTPIADELPFPGANNQTTFATPQPSVIELNSVGNVVPETNLPQEMLKGSSILVCEPSQPSVPPSEELGESLGCSQLVVSDTMQLVQPQPHFKTEEIIDDRHFVFGDHPLEDKMNRVQKAVEFSVSPIKDSGPVELPRRVLEPTPETETVTIDLTMDESPAERTTQLHKASVDLVCSDVDIRTSPNLSDGIAVEDPTFVSSPRNRRRSVTFASPIEYVLEKKAKTKAQSSYRSPFESNTLSPVRIPTGVVNVKHELPDRITSRIVSQSSKSSQGSVHNKSTGEAEIQDIVEVLNEIQAVIIKGISDRFSGVRKDVQRNRDELIQQVLNELRAMAVDNAKYFNGLLRLEEDYHTNCKAITRCWEELIDCNHAAAVQFQNTLKEHDQSISARAFPKSFVPLQPAFPRRA